MKAAFCTSKDDKSSCIKFPGSKSPKHEGGLISKNPNLISNSVEGGFDTCSFLNEPSDATIFAFGESYEACGGSLAFDGESTGTLAFSGGGECCGSIASSGGSSFSGGGGSYSC